MLNGDSINWIRLGLDFLQFAGTITAFAAAWWVRKTSANKKAIEQLNDRVGKVERHQDVLVSRIEAAPTHADIGKVYDRLNDASQTMNKLAGQLGALSHQLSMINEYLLNHRGGA